MNAPAERTVTDITDVAAYMQGLGRAAREASRALARADTNAKNRALTVMAAAIRREAAALLGANADDVAAAQAAGLDAAMIDRLTLTAKGVENMAAGLEQIAALADPVGEMGGFAYRPSGIQVGRMRVSGCHRHHLRGAPECDGGRRRSVSEERQRLHSARRL